MPNRVMVFFIYNSIDCRGLSKGGAEELQIGVAFVAATSSTK
jgi:hypothetical protein